MRAVALDVHRDFCEVAIVAEGRLRSAGRIETRPEALELFAQSLDPRDRVALEVTGNAWEIARIIEPHVARVIVVSPSDTGIRQARAKTDRLDARALAQAAVGGSAGQGVDAGRAHPRDAPPAGAPVAAGAGAHAREERDPRGLDALPEGPPAGVGSVRRQGPALAGRAAAGGRASARRSTPRAPGRLPRRRDREVEQLIAAEALNWPEVKRLMTVPGVNVIVAATFMAAVGDIRRFRDRRKLTAYLGLDPRVRQSGDGPATHGHISKQGSAQRPSRARRGVLVDGPPARPDRRLLPARPSPPRALDRDRRLRAQARVSVLVLLDPRRGLRLRAALADDQEDAPARARRRRPAPAGRPRRLVDQRRDARSRTRTRAPSPARLRTHRSKTANRTDGRERDTGARIKGSSKEQAARQTTRP